MCGLPGIAAVMLAPDLSRPDDAYPSMMALVPTGLLGLVCAALIAAIIASTASKINSIATIFTLDIYAKLKHVKTRAEDATGEEGQEKKLVLIGRTAAVVAIILAILTARPLLVSLDQAFQYIDRKSVVSGKSVSVRVDLGGGRII